MSEKRIQLEQAATETVQRGGLRSLSFRTLADEVGIKSSSVHYHFPEKADLAGALIDRYSEEFQMQLAQIDASEAGAREKLLAFVAIFEDVVQADKFCLCGMMAAEVEALDDDNRSKLADYFDSTEAWLVQTLSTGKCVMKPQVLAPIILSGLEGAILLDRVDGSQSRVKAQQELVRKLVK